MGGNAQAESKYFVEDVGIIFEQTGLPRMAGRIFGWLLVSDPQHQSTDQLAEALMASKGSMSSMTRLLIQAGFIERLSLPGVRHDYFRICNDACRHIIRHGLEEEITMFRKLAEHGLEVLPKKTPPSTRKWLEEMHGVYAYLEREFPTMLQQWQKEHTKKLETSRKTGSASSHGKREAVK